MAELTSTEPSPDCIFGIKAGTKSCKSDLTPGSAGASPLNPPCPKCNSTKIWRDAKRYTVFGDEIQRWLCRDCGLRFSDPADVKKSWSTQEKTARSELSNEIKMTDDLVSTRQICVTETKNLGAEQQSTEVLRRNQTGEVKGKIIEYAWWLKKDGKSDSTIRGRTKILQILTKRGANLYDPESIKAIIAKQPWCNGRKNNACDT